MRSSIIAALFAVIATPMLSVAYPATQGRQELNFRALAEENSISARQITEAIVHIFERSFDEGDLVRRARPNGDCTSGMGQAGLTGPACAAANGHGWMSVGLCFSRQQMMMQGNVVRGTCYF